MIKLSEMSGGTPDQPELLDEKWGKEMCQKLSEYVADGEVADFYDESVRVVYQITSHTSEAFMIEVLQTGVKYGVNLLGGTATFDPSGTKTAEELRNIVDEIVIDELPDMTKKKVEGK